MTSIIFDLDGTLADSTACIVETTHYVGRLHQLRKVSDDAIRMMIGQPLRAMLSTLFEVRDQRLDILVRDYSTEYVRLAPIQERRFAGTIPLLKNFQGPNWKLGIATGKSQKGADHATARLGIAQYFDSIHGILPGTPGKPDPAVLLRAIDALNASPKDCIMVGDTSYDMDLAKAVSVRCVAVTWGVHSLEILQSRSPDFIATSFDSLAEWLLAQS